MRDTHAISQTEPSIQSAPSTPTVPDIIITNYVPEGGVPGTRSLQPNAL